MASLIAGPGGEAVAGGEKKVLLASPRAFCAGVERAIQTVERVLECTAGPVYVRKQIVHNTVVVADLQARGAIFIDELDEIPDPAPPGTVVVFSAHGVSPKVRAAADQRGLQVVDATCPLVAKVHAEAARFAARGDTVVLIGHRGHEESEGTLGVAPQSTVLVQTTTDVATLNIPADAQVSYLTQTTLAVDETTTVIDALRRRFPQLGEPPSDDICYATTNRQRAVRSIVDECDVLLVIGSQNSSNSQSLVGIAQRRDTPAYLIDGPDDINPDWLTGATTIGVTAGASAPPGMVALVVDALRAHGPLIVSERSVATETARFILPQQVRTP
ncbi:4-hydroxy-3-methylbut-2-enyl diphosphate reductase 1 [Mycobacterium simulans]|uniref:4-hydroxy-3-methylbut-2-enyl diphosphate reductase n=1 Tax=Mycobacterium simulans TaxID=627089 RepID=A0A7Z7N8H0_9MYCO|nr:4-hydroxy-3-methylbut-2-enyl diphosphate reductase [Mycobacterium simulans]SOJ52756.1 4-hydroxy-3-methylbut-2-enyl diphosphate reductase 1 [Mycobacterium simulans]